MSGELQKKIQMMEKWLEIPMSDGAFRVLHVIAKYVSHENFSVVARNGTLLRTLPGMKERRLQQLKEELRELRLLKVEAVPDRAARRHTLLDPEGAKMGGEGGAYRCTPPRVPLHPGGCVPLHPSPRTSAPPPRTVAPGGCVPLHPDFPPKPPSTYPVQPVYQGTVSLVGGVKVLTFPPSTAKDSQGKGTPGGGGYEGGRGEEGGKTPEGGDSFFERALTHVRAIYFERKDSALFLSRSDRGVLWQLYEHYQAEGLMALYDLWWRKDEGWSDYAARQGRSLKAFLECRDQLLDHPDYKSLKNGYFNELMDEMAPLPLAVAEGEEN